MYDLPFNAIITYTITGYEVTHVPPNSDIVEGEREGFGLYL